MRGLALIVGLVLALNPFVVSAAADEDGVGGGELQWQTSTGGQLWRWSSPIPLYTGND